METDVGGETVRDLAASAANRDRTVRAAADRHGQPNGPCEAAGKLSCDWTREIVEVRDRLSRMSEP